MTKEVILAIKGLQMAPGEAAEPIEVIAPGEYYYRNDKHYILYDEVVEGQDEVIKNVIKCQKDYMELTKKGPVNVHMVFEKNKKNMTYYYTPYGSLQMGIDAKNIQIDEAEEYIRLSVDYGLEINFEHIANCNITIKVSPKGAQVKL